MASRLAAEANALQQMLQRRGRTHLRVSARGDNLTVYSGAKTAPEPRLRLTRLSGGEYGISFPASNGRWDPFPFSGPLAEALDFAEAHFSFFLDAD
jgi:hypothetical protein